MDVVNKILEDENNKNDHIQQLVNVEKEIDVDIDEGTLLVSDYNTLNLKTKSKIETNLEALTRDNVQLLINKVWSLPIKCVEEVILAELPKPKYVLPRSRTLPKPKSLTKWQQFAKDKGITTKKKGRSKLKWDDLLQKWIPTYGYRNAEAEKQKEWLVECQDDGKPIQDPFAAFKASKNEKKAKNELQRLRNLAKAKKVKIPKVGLPSSEHFKDSKQLSMGLKVLRLKYYNLKL
jgi:regulator of ribosome biosynthesis